MKAVADDGHTIKMLVHYSYINEVHRVVSPEILGYSKVYEIYENIREIFGREIDRIDRINFGLPPLSLLHQRISDFDPDLVVLRDYSLYSVLSMISAWVSDSHVIMYDQLPKYGPTYGRRMRLCSRLYRRLWDRDMVRITPVQGNQNECPDTNAFYIPFVKTPSDEAFSRSYADGGTIRILSIGKYASERKKHILLLDAINDLMPDYPIQLTFIGHIDDYLDENFSRIRKEVDGLGLDDVVEIRTNVPYKEVQNAYLTHDLFVLPSRDESAAVSHLEAMAHGLPVICSDSNGTQWYIEENVNGYVFTTDDVQDLRDKITKIVSSPERIRKMGGESLRIVQQQHSPEVYIDKFKKAAHRAGVYID
jgi:glycosyltransferase involved in cell wall biosynthesis